MKEQGKLIIKSNWYINIIPGKKPNYTVTKMSVSVFLTMYKDGYISWFSLPWRGVRQSKVTWAAQGSSGSQWQDQE